MPASLPALDGPIAAQHTKSIVVDLPFGIRGGLPVIGDGFSPETMVLPTADGHPLADALISLFRQWVLRPDPVVEFIRSRNLYAPARDLRDAANPATLR